MNEEVFRLADELKAKKLAKEEMEAKVKALNGEIDELDAKLCEEMVNQELDKFTRNGSTFYLKSRLFASPVAEHKVEFIQALKDNNCGNLITEQVNANTLSSFIKEFQETHDGLERPEFLGEDLLNIFVKTSIGIRKS